MNNHQLIHSSKTNEWYTPLRYIEAARQVMGGLDLDPASCEAANKVVQASIYFDSCQNGLLHDWHGRVWLNPPYGRTGKRSNQDIWSAYLIRQYKKGITQEAILLVNAMTDCLWFKRLWEFPICFTHGRIKFYNENGQSSRPTHGNAFVYMGSNTPKFVEIFKDFGTIAQAVLW